MKKTICDHCGQWIDTGEPSSNRASIKGPQNDYVKLRYDFCNDCVKALRLWIGGRK